MKRPLAAILLGIWLAPCLAAPAPVPMPDAVDAVDAAAPTPGASATGVPEQLLVGDVLARLRARLQPGACAAGSGASTWRQRFSRDRRGFAAHVLDFLPLLEFVLAEVERRELPGEFALIPIIESGYRPAALGPGGPAGMWQMIATTARNHGVAIGNGYDGRLSPIESTRAALSYLDALQRRFGDWKATVMAYNAGEFRLLGAMRRDGGEVAADRGRPRGLSPITYNYVHKLQALSCLLGDTPVVQLPLQQRRTRLQPVEVAADVVSLQGVAAAVGATGSELQALNPGFRHGRIPAGAPRLVLVPAPDGSVRQAPAAASPGEPAQLESPAPAAPPETAEDGAEQTHRVDRGDTLWSIARRYGTSTEALRRRNGLGGGQALRPGQRLWIPD